MRAGLVWGIAPETRCKPGSPRDWKMAMRVDAFGWRLWDLGGARPGSP